MSDYYKKYEEDSAKIRQLIISTADYCKGKIHWGGSLSCVEILNYLYTMLINNIEIKDIKNINDQIIVSKGHAALALYSVLSVHGFFKEDFRLTYQSDGSFFPEEITMDEFLSIPCSTGSLGLGLPFATGKALKSKRNFENKTYYVLMGDGECNEGSVWESVMFAAQNKLDNLCVIIDRNKLQSDGNTEEIISMNNLEKNFASFGWHTSTICGHSYKELSEAFKICKTDKPRVIIAETIKGKGISFMENNYIWHDKVLNRDLLEIAKCEVGINNA